jgi:phosphoglycerol transferase
VDNVGAARTPGYPAQKAQATTDAAFVATLERTLPADAMVFQLPFISFPEGDGAERTGGYDHFIPYLYSKTLRWSFGAVRGREGAIWQQAVASRSGAALAEGLKSSGFAAIWIDRRGYRDRGHRLEQSLREATLSSPLQSSNGRYAVFILATR